MPLFHYTARDAQGQLVHGQEKAESRYEALAAVTARGLMVTAMDDININPLPEPGGEGGRWRYWLVRRVRLSDRSVFCRQLAVSVSSGIPLRESLENIMADLEHETFRSVLRRVLQRLTDGLPFSQAVAAEPQVFDRLFVALIRAAEEAGSMPETLEYLADSMGRPTGWRARSRACWRIRSLSSSSSSWSARS